MPVPRGQRNNNPCNIDYNPKNKWIGQLGIEEGVVQPRFARFDCPENGIRAAVRLIINYIVRYKLNTVRDIISRWAPSNENFTEAYISAVERKSGIGTAKVDPANADQMFALIVAIITHELGMQPYHTSTIYEGIYRAGIRQR